MHRLSLFFVLLASVIPSFAAPTPLAPFYTSGGPTKPGSFIVKLNKDADQNGVLALLQNLAGTNTVNQQWSPDFYNAFEGNFDQSAIDAFRSNPNVEYVSENGIMSAFDTQNNAPWNLARISTRDKLVKQNPFALDFQYNYKGSTPGKDVDIYVVDTGILITHPDLVPRASWGGTFCDQCQDKDGHGHGTHVSGTAAGTRYGVAKAANLIAVKVLNDAGSGAYSEIISGLQWIQKKAKTTGRPSIATMSLGGPSSQPVIDAVTSLIFSGIHCTVAAGNSNEDAKDTSPANTPLAITVGATDITDSRAFYSNYGPIVDIFAPGSNVTSAWNDGGIKTISGTSMATPAVAGMVAYFLNILGPKTSPETMSGYITMQASLLKLSNIPVGTFNLLAYNGGK